MIGKRLAQLRKEFKLTQEELAQQLKITRSALSLYELNKRDADTETINRIADYFNVSIDYLLGRTDIRNPYGKNKKNSEEDDIYNIIDELPEEELEELKKYAQYLKVKSALEKAGKESSVTLDDAG